jgi:D-cysteine desulfhydrase family pyridoxal phosphate-dependent enzyme
MNRPDSFVAALEAVPKFGLASYPTPLERLPRLSSCLRRDLWMKRDDLFGLGLGGNKVRKLDLILTDAVSIGADLLITRGGIQSNHCRITAAAAARLGVGCTVVLTGEKPAHDLGSVFLDRLFGAKVVMPGPITDAQADAMMEDLAEVHRQHGGRPYIVPMGGANALGVLAYAQAAVEIVHQCEERGIHPHSIVLAVGTASTYAGLALGLWAAAVEYHAIGISVSRPVERLIRETPSLILEACERLFPGERVPDVRLLFFDRYVGSAYAVPSPEGLEAVRLVGRTEGIGLDTTYTGKAFSGLLDLCERGILKDAGCAIFLHTGGIPEIFARDPATILHR